MAASVQFRQRENSFAAMKEKEDDLALFLEMRNIEDDRENNFLLHNSEGFNDLLGSEPDNSCIRKMASTMASKEPISDGFLNSEDKSDFEWFLTPPDIPLFSSSDMESPKTVVVQVPASNEHSAAPKPKLANPLVEPTSKSNSTSKRSTSSISTTRKPTPNVSRSSTPTPRPILPSTTKPSRSSTPTSRSTIPTTKPTPTLRRSSTPTKPSTRSSTPSSKPSISTATSKSTSRSSTPSHKPGPTIKNRVPSRGSSPTMKPRPQKDDGPMSVRSSGRSTSTNGRQRQQSSSPLRAQNGNAYDNMRSMIAKSRGRADCRDDVNPVLMGTQMVERVVNMRKLAPPKKDDYHSNHNNSSGKSSSSQESSGFGRSLSKKSFDMALRHMDIRRSIPGNMRSLMTNVPASSVYSVRSGPTKSTTVSVSDSTLATSCSTASLNGSEIENDYGSET